MNTSYKTYDHYNMHRIIYNFAEQLEEALGIGASIQLSNTYTTITSIVFAGMGGSAIAGDIVSLLTAPTSTLPLTVIRNYTLPTWVNQHTLVICLSYSGNTEETLSAYEDATKKGAMIMGITSGGLLAEQLTANRYDTIRIPSGLPPRASLGYLAVPLLFVMHHMGLLPKNFTAHLQDAISHLKTYRTLWALEGSEENQAYAIAKTIYKSYPLIYGEADQTSTIARRWRGQLAENSKMLSGMHELPELNHNEIVGFHKNPDLLKQMGVIWLVDQEIPARIAKRLEITKKIIDPAVGYQITIEALGATFMARMLYLIHLGDWVSFWCAILHHEDPTPVDRITKLKKLMTH